MDLITRLGHTASMLIQFSKNENTQEITEGYIRTRLELLEKYWSGFQSTFEQLQQSADFEAVKEEGLDSYSQIERLYIEAKSNLYDEQSSLNGSAAHVSPTPPCEDRQSTRLGNDHHVKDVSHSPTRAPLPRIQI